MGHYFGWGEVDGVVWDIILGRWRWVGVDGKIFWVSGGGCGVSGGGFGVSGGECG